MARIDDGEGLVDVKGLMFQEAVCKVERTYCIIPILHDQNA